VRQETKHGRLNGPAAALSALARFEPGPWWMRVFIGLGFAAAVLLLRWSMSFAYGSLTGFVILLPGVILAALAAGRVAGVTAMLAALAGGWLLVEPSGAGAETGRDMARIVSLNFLGVGLFSTWLAASLRDVVKRLSQTDAALDEEERRFRDIADVAPVMLWSADASGRVYVNAEFRRFWGARPMDGADMKVWIATIHPDDRDRVVQASTRALTRREPVEIEARYLRHDGEWRTLRTYCRPRSGPDSGFLGMVGANVDVTESRDAELRLRESEARFRLMADTAPSPVWMTNADAEVEFVNQALVDFYGVPAERLLGHVWKQTIHPDDAADVARVMGEARPLRRPYGFECRFQRADGVWRWTRVAVKPRFDGAGEFMGYVGMAFDVTETREALDALAELERRQSLLLALSDRLRDLAEPEAVMHEAARTVGEALGAVRVAYGEIDETGQRIAVRRPWFIVGAHDPQGLWPLNGIGDAAAEALREGRVVRLLNPADQAPDLERATAWRKNGGRSVVAAPVCRGAVLQAVLYAVRNDDRPWTDAEAALVEDVAARAFAEVERTRAELEVRESEQRFRAVADTAPVLIWVTDADRVRAFVNQAYVAFNGGTYEEARLADWRAALHPDDHRRIAAESIAGEATGRPFSLEARYRRHDGEWRWLKSFSRPRLGPEGQVIGFVGVAFDVTDIRESAETLANAAAERDAILSQLAEGVIVTDPDGRIVFVNEAAVRQHGVERLDVAPEDYSETYHLFTEAGEPHPFEDLPLTRAVLKGETVADARWRIRRPDGTEVLAVGNARPVVAPDGRKIGAVLTLRDETARVEAENRLVESEARFRTVADSAPIPMWMGDAEGDVVFANLAYRTFFQVLDKPLKGGWTRMMHGEDAETFHRDYRRAFERREAYDGMVRVIHPELGPRWLRCQGVPRFDAGGQFQGYVGANVDVTEAKQAEVDLKRINELLEERVGAALAEKAKAEADLMHAQRMEAVGRLTGGVAHDFNNLLTVVIGALDMMLKAPDDARRQARLGEAALAAARRGERLTHQLLAFSRRQTLRPEPTDLNALILEGEPLLRRAVGEAVRLDLKLSEKPARVNVDPAQFEAALLNLVVNARDAVSEGGRIVIETRVRRLRAGQVAEMVAGDHVCIAVSDDGAGIDPDVLPRIFEPFFTTKAVGKGTGLGLSQVYGFSRQSGGGLDVESVPGGGTTIRMFLPAIRGAAAAPPAAQDAPLRPSRPGRRLLLVEDDAAVAAVAAEMIESLGFEVRVTDHAAAALQILGTQTFDVMLTDVVMPGGMSGVELARTTSREWPAMSVVLASGYAAEEMDRVVADAPWPFVRKPYSRETLAEVLTAEVV